MNTSKIVSFSMANFEKHIAIENKVEFQSAMDLISSLQNAGFEAVFAGGCVRDALMRRPPADFDIATNATPDQVLELFDHAIEVGKAFGVIIIVFEGYQIEVASFRQDGKYSDGRKPDSVVLSTAEEDAQRRDFTVNALLYDPKSNLIMDYVGGLADLENKLLRTVGEPVRRFDEDKLRLLRGIRFVSQLDFELEESTASEIKKRFEQISLVSMERRRDELKKVLKLQNPLKSLFLLMHWNYLKEIDPVFEILYSQDLETDKIFKLAHDQKILSEMFLVTFCLRLQIVWQKNDDLFADRTHSLKSSLSSSVRKILNRLKWSKEDTNFSLQVLEGLFLIEMSQPGATQMSMGRMNMGQWLDWASRPTTPLTIEIYDFMVELNLLNHSPKGENGSSALPDSKELSQSYRVENLTKFKFSEPMSFEEVRSKLAAAAHLIADIKDQRIVPVVSGKDLLGVGYEPGDLFKTLIREAWFIYLEMLYFKNTELASKQGIVSLLPQKEQSNC